MKLMNKRFGLALVFIFTFFAAFPASAQTVADEPDEVRGEMTIEVTVSAPAGNSDTKVWLPLPVSDDFQKIENVKVEGNYTKRGNYKEEVTGNNIIYAEWVKPSDDQRRITLSFAATARKRSNMVKVDKEPKLPKKIKPYLGETAFIPTGGAVKKIADEVSTGKKGIAEKALAVYNWVVDNTFRDPDVKGCGVGDVDQMLAKRGGKCVDISSVYVSIARASGVPAREVFGVRLGRDEGVSDMTKGHHCWAEYYVPGAGWVPTDPADVRKYILEKKLENDPAEAAKYRAYYSNAVDPYRIVVATGGRGYFLNPKQKAGPLNYFMYPYAEVDGKALEWLAAQKELKYKITFKKS